MAKYDNIDVNGKDAFKNKTPSYEDVMKQKAKDTKKALHKQKKEDDMEAAGKAMDEEVAKDYEAQKEVEKQALENNGSTEEMRDRNKAVQEGDKTAIAIEDAKVEAKKPVENNGIEQIASEAKIDEEAPAPVTEEKEEAEIPESVQQELDSSDEGQQANAAVEANDPAALQNIVTPEGEAVLKGSYDANGLYVPYTYNAADGRLVKNKGLAACLTIISKAITALGMAAGIPVPPINFLELGVTDDDRAAVAKLNENEQNYAKVINGTKTPAMETSNVREAQQEANISDVGAYKNLSNEDVQKAAQVNASVGGQNTALDVQREAQAWEAKQKELDREFQKEMNGLSTESQIAILQQQGINQQELASLMNDLDVQRVFKKIAMAKEKGLSEDDLAKWIRAEQGTTKLAAALNYVGTAGEVAGQVAGALMTGGVSDKDCKKFVYDGKAANSKMFSKARPKW